MSQITETKKSGKVLWWGQGVPVFPAELEGSEAKMSRDRAHMMPTPSIRTPTRETCHVHIHIFMQAHTSYLTLHCNLRTDKHRAHTASTF